MRKKALYVSAAIIFTIIVTSIAYILLQAYNVFAPTKTDTTSSYEITVYFSKHPDSDNDPTLTYPVSRLTENDAAAKYAIEQLIEGPTSAEEELGYYSDVKLRNDTSNCNGEDFTLIIRDSTATLQFCRTFDAIGIMSDARAEQVINDTLTQFSGIDSVIVLTKNGDCQFDLSGENFCLQ